MCISMVPRGAQPNQDLKALVALKAEVWVVWTELVRCRRHRLPVKRAVS